MLRLKRFVPLSILLVAAVVAVIVPQGRAHAATHFSHTHEATALPPEAVGCEITLTSRGSVSATSGPMLSCSAETIWSVWDMIDEHCDGSGYAFFSCDEDGGLAELALLCLDS